jgi:hypothetical protein
VKNKGELDVESRSWTRPNDYLGVFARRRTARKQREPVRRRTQTDQPHFLLSTLPFLLLFGALIVITIGMVALAWPGSQATRVQMAQSELRAAPDGSVEIVMQPRALEVRKETRKPSRG